MKSWLVKSVVWFGGGYLAIGVLLALYMLATTGIFLPSLILVWPRWIQLLFTVI